MTTSRFIGVDPGPVPGIVELTVDEGRIVTTDVVQCSAGIAAFLLGALLEAPFRTLVQVERFVVGPRAGRSGHAGAGEATRDLIGQLQTVHPQLVLRSAAQVKPWASDERLERAGLLEATRGMRHARDAARHALFAAVHDGTLPDPLSRKASA